MPPLKVKTKQKPAWSSAKYFPAPYGFSMALSLTVFVPTAQRKQLKLRGAQVHTARESRAGRCWGVSRPPATQHGPCTGSGPGGHHTTASVQPSPNWLTSTQQFTEQLTLSKGELTVFLRRINRTKGQPEVHLDSHSSWSFTHAHINVHSRLSGPAVFTPVSVYPTRPPSHSARKLEPPFPTPPPAVPPVSCPPGSSEGDVLLSVPQARAHSSLVWTLSWAFFHLPPVTPNLGNVASLGGLGGKATSSGNNLCPHTHPRLGQVSLLGAPHILSFFTYSHV